MARSIGVSIAPGHMQFTRIYFRAKSRAVALVNIRTPPFDAS
jgi:hypothetical protein